MNKWVERAVLGVVALLIGLCLGWAIRGVTTYSMQAQTITNFQDWRTACPPAAEKTSNCRIVQQVMDTRNGQPVVTLSIVIKGKDSALDVSVPLGVLLPPGAALGLGTDKPIVFPFRTCTQTGCLAELKLDDKIITALTAAKDGKILVAGMDSKAVAIPISMKGYADAAKAYHSAEQRRSSWLWRLFS